jgi:hypothetical protein
LELALRIVVVPSVRAAASSAFSVTVSPRSVSTMVRSKLPGAVTAAW